MTTLFASAGVGLALVLAGPAHSQDPDDTVAAILQADRDFAAMAAEQGASAAFVHWMDASEGRLIRGTPDPIIGAENIAPLYAPFTGDTLLHWQPSEGFAGSGDDFGVTWGVWSIHSDGDSTSAPVARGTYVTVWRRNADGDWRGLLDMGTDDPSYQPGQTGSESPDDGGDN
ncbi:hypothetical protein AWH62_07465 [Maricaulis sp. W15]|uniref:Ketosteroid isomerase-like protein n=1 Tax=Maricaulis maris TaxID=74318 RepID=A0A495DD58_9PROT|nr:MULTISPECIES: hypothetical protein [Maricaulis]OLF73979.1 hypothetical protein AWH62_07465 [Maricaulis sp. W15]RKR00230.1 hypothetical protein C7435_1431 [Maricaulis maris]